MGMTEKRLNFIDSLRGITICSMVLYHAFWDLTYIYRLNLPFMRTQGAFLWQQSICWSFILISGFCWSLGRHPVRHGLRVFALGLLITGITVWIMPGQRIVFGILTFLGSAMLMMYPLDHFLRKIPSATGAILSFFLFLSCYNINQGLIGFSFLTGRLPESLYRNYYTTYLGFPFKGFYSTDYFSILPWFFLYLAGYYLYKISMIYIIDNKDPFICSENFFSRIGRKSLLIYIIHQPCITTILTVVFHAIHLHNR